MVGYLTNLVFRALFEEVEDTRHTNPIVSAVVIIVTAYIANIALKIITDGSNPNLPEQIGPMSFDFWNQQTPEIIMNLSIILFGLVLPSYLCVDHGMLLANHLRRLL